MALPMPNAEAITISTETSTDRRASLALMLRVNTTSIAAPKAAEMIGNQPIATQVIIATRITSTALALPETRRTSRSSGATK